MGRCFKRVVRRTYSVLDAGCGVLPHVGTEAGKTLGE